MIEGSNVGCRFVWGMLSRFKLELDLIYDLQRASCKKDEGRCLVWLAVMDEGSCLVWLAVM